MTELQSGVTLGRYELLVRIGRGGMASVWVARERSAVSGKQRLVAVKAMLPELAAHSEFRSMFLGEVQIIQSINHDNVVRVFEVSEDRGTLYMAMEWVEGDSLRNVIRAARSRAALPPEIAVRIAADAAAGLHAAHELRDWDGELRGIVHCDVSPHNILVGIDGKAKLVDFGIANALGRLDPEGDGENIKGKLSYMSPEQARGEKLDRRTDVFALGIVLFEMTTGEQLFKGRDAEHTLELVRGGTIPLPSQLNSRYPKQLEAIVMRALDRDRERRFQTAEEFGQMLTNYLYEERILVSHSAVAQLLMRVIGPRIERRREVISRIAQVADGQLPTVEPGSQPGTTLADLSPMHSDPFNYTLTNAGDESALGIAARLESQTIAAQVTSTNRNEAAELVEADPPSRAWVWLSAAVVLLVVGATVAFKMTRSQNASFEVAGVPTVSPGKLLPPAPPLAPAAPASQPQEQTDRGQNAESLPVADESPRNPSTPYARRGTVRHVASTRDAVRPANLRLERADQTDIPPASAGKTATPSAANADSATQSAASKPTSAEEGINRAAANASLATAAAAATGCRGQGDTPTGQGRAAVTFAPDGSVIAVSLSQRFTGTATGTCIAARFRQAHAPAFSGEAVTLFYPFQIPE